MKHFSTVEEYISSFPKDTQKLLESMRQTIKLAAPQAKEKISYKLPFYEYKFPGYKGRLAYFGAFKEHVSLFIVPRDVPPAMAEKLKPYKASKSAIHFPLGKKVPTDLIKDLVELRKREIDQSE